MSVVRRNLALYYVVAAVLGYIGYKGLTKPLYNPAETRAYANRYADFASELVCKGTEAFKADADITSAAEQVLLGALGDTQVKDLTFVYLGQNRFKFALRDRALFPQHLDHADKALADFEQQLDRRVFARVETFDMDGGSRLICQKVE